MVASIFVLCVAATPFFALPLAALALLFHHTFTLFRATSTDLKRLEVLPEENICTWAKITLAFRFCFFFSSHKAVTRSPVYASFSEALTGLDTLRAFGATGRFLRDHTAKMDANVGCFFHLWMSTCWVTVRLETMGSAVLFSVALVAVLVARFADDLGIQQVDPLLLGMALVYALQLTALFQRTVQVIIDTETYMTSVERLLELLAAPSEVQEGLTLGLTLTAPTAGHGHGHGHLGHDHLSLAPVAAAAAAASHLAAGWPSRGTLVFENVSLRYRDGPLVLDGCSLVCQGGTRVGVCGRTGAGKSSLIQALFRIVEVERGTITLDGVDLRTVSLPTLRSALAIIPQDPVIFSGTLR
jgi:ABC-type multidrug transport system fused ATPase/permease subunit